MAIHLREADLIGDEPALIALANRYLDGMDVRRFRWLYRENPFGPARAWLAFDGDVDTPIGMAALFPRRNYLDGSEVLGCVFGDFCVSSKYRTLGPAIQLQRACLAVIESGQFAFSYDFPSTSMISIYKFMGLSPTHTSVRMAKLLRLDDKVRSVVPTSVLSKAVSSAVSFALSKNGTEDREAKGFEYRLDEQPCSIEYSRLWERAGGSLGCGTVRNPEYLNWRYRSHPSRQYEFLLQFRGGELQGYGIFTVADGRAQIADLFGAMNEDATRALLTRLVKLLRGRGASAIDISVLSGDSRISALRRLGFHVRESTPVIACASKLSRFGSALSLMHGDRES